MKGLFLFTTLILTLTSNASSQVSIKKNFKVDCFSKLSFETSYSDDSLRLKLIEFLPKFTEVQMYNSPRLIDQYQDENGTSLMKWELVLRFTFFSKTSIDTQSVSFIDAYYNGRNVTSVGFDIKDVVQQWITRGDVPNSSKLLSLESLGCEVSELITSDSALNIVNF